MYVQSRKIEKSNNFKIFRFVQSLALCMFCRSVFVLLSFFLFAIVLSVLRRFSDPDDPFRVSSIYICVIYIGPEQLWNDDFNLTTNNPWFSSLHVSSNTLSRKSWQEPQVLEYLMHGYVPFVVFTIIERWLPQELYTLPEFTPGFPWGSRCSNFSFLYNV
jgi:hypothetical protein